MGTDKDPAPTRELWEGVWRNSTVARSVHSYLLEAVGQVLDLQGARVLEVGCGSAVDSGELNLRGACTFGLDYSLCALSQARIYSIQRNATVHLTAGDVFCLPYQDGIFDLVFSQGLLEHFADPNPALREQARVLRTGGFLCADVPQTWSWRTLYKRWHIWRRTWFAGWETEFTLEDVEALMRSNGLEIRGSYGWLYFPAFLYGIRNFHTLDERHHIPVWISTDLKQEFERVWLWLERQRWYFRWLGCIGVIGQKA